MVRLKETTWNPRYTSIYHFNSSMVRLKEKMWLPLIVLAFYFNSSMVRLKVHHAADSCPLRSFQFLYGAIKRSIAEAEPGDIFINFNSSMVRLKGYPGRKSCAQTSEFQFLYGAIKRKPADFCPYCALDFNSSMVRLKELVCP
mgnify:FL=1